jgi:branched-chain amino acid transport system ATP-binding protein
MPQEERAILSTRGVTVQFGGLTALDAVTLEIYEKERVGLIGPNGSGKTTLFNCITGFVQPRGGRIYYNGENITGLRPNLVSRKGVSRTFQLAKLFGGLSVMENVRMPLNLNTAPPAHQPLKALAGRRQRRAEVSEKAEQILEEVGLIEKRHETAGSLPYGAQRLLSLAIALSCSPKLLLLDEPSAGMNRDETRQLRAVLQAINARGVSLFLVEHNIEFVKDLVSRMIVLNYGSLLCQGNPREVCDDPQVCEAYFGRAV